MAQSRKSKTASPRVPAVPQPAAEAAAVADHEYANRLTWFPRFLALLRREPALALTMGYLTIMAVGLWTSFWYYRAFGIPILEFMQIGDFLMSGLRDPVGLGFLAYLLGCSLLALWPTQFWMRHPDRIEVLRRTWWGRWLFRNWMSPFRRKRWFEVSPEASIVLGLVLGGGAWIMTHAHERAGKIIADPMRTVQVTLSGHDIPLQGQAQLLGTTGSHVFLYWPANGRTEALNLEAVARLERWPRRIDASLRTPSE